MSTYVISSPKFVSVVQRNNKTLKFDPLITAVSKKVLRIPRSDLEKMERSKIPGTPHLGFMKDLQEVHHRIFGSGAALNKIRNEALKSFAELLSPENTPNQLEVNLYDWNQHIHTISTSRAIWGSKNPFENRPDLEEAFW